MAKTVAVVQSNYIPWKGYFDLINKVDEFILFDDVQFTRRDWRNRNQIKTARGPVWLSIPVNSKGQYLAPIKDITVSEPDWAEKHWKSLGAHYKRAPHFGRFEERFRELYLGHGETLLSAINHRFIAAVCEILGIRARITWSMDYRFDRFAEDRNRRLLGLCQQAGATRYISGPTARAYMDDALFAHAGIAVDYMDYSGYPEYPQLHPPFTHALSVVDLLFNAGPDAPRYMLSFG